MEYLGEIMKDVKTKSYVDEEIGGEQRRLESCYNAIFGLMINEDDDDRRCMRLVFLL
jgi:hypothetical protein